MLNFQREDIKYAWLSTKVLDDLTKQKVKELKDTPINLERNTKL